MDTVIVFVNKVFVNNKTQCTMLRAWVVFTKCLVIHVDTATMKKKRALWKLFNWKSEGLSYRKIAMFMWNECSDP